MLSRTLPTPEQGALGHVKAPLARGESRSAAGGSGLVAPAGEWPVAQNQPVGSTVAMPGWTLVGFSHLGTGGKGSRGPRAAPPPRPATLTTRETHQSHFQATGAR